MSELADLLATYASHPEPRKRALLIAGVISEALRAVGGNPIVTGGTAVEAYTGGAYMTHDLDLFVALDPQHLRDAMASLGFTRARGSRYFLLPGTGIYVEFPGSHFEGDTDRVSVVEVRDEEGRWFNVTMIGVEDILMHRVDSVAATGDESDKLWAVRLMCLYWDELDWAYLEAWAARTLADAALSECRRLAEHYRRGLQPG